MNEPKVPTVDDLHYSFWPCDHYLIDDDGNIVGVIPKPIEIPLSKQKFTQISNINFNLYHLTYETLP
jgi:hypothetical protein